MHHIWGLELKTTADELCFSWSEEPRGRSSLGSLPGPSSNQKICTTRCKGDRIMLLHLTSWHSAAQVLPRKYQDFSPGGLLLVPAPVSANISPHSRHCASTHPPFSGFYYRSMSRTRWSVHQFVSLVRKQQPPAFEFRLSW